MSASTLVTEATRYLEAIDLYRSLELDVTWRSEADDAHALRFGGMGPDARCNRCTSPRVRINGRHLCLGVH